MKRVFSMGLAILLVLSFLVVPVSAADTIYSGVQFKTNANGPTLAVHQDSGVEFLEVDGNTFKDLNQNGKLDPYEDWRLSSQERAADLASRLDLDHQLALMLHGSVRSVADVETGVRFNLTRDTSAADVMAEANNQRQLWAETDDLGIPVVTSTDPRHTGTVESGDPTTSREGGTVSSWPQDMGLSASFSTEMQELYGGTVSAEYRALGIHMMLGPQIDLVTEPRWGRNYGSRTEDFVLNADLAAAFIEAMQTTDSRDSNDDWGIDDGWGLGSVATMAKHWPSGGTGEFGYDAHNDWGKFGVYPGGSFEEVLEAFANGAGVAKEYEGTTRQVSSIMPYYTIVFDQDPSGKNVGNGFSEYIIQQRLRDDYEYDGMVTTDWGISNGRTYWGYEPGKGYDAPYRVLMTMLAGVDQQGGMESANLSVMQAAYEMGAYGSEEFGVEALGEETMDKIAYTSSVRILKIIFNLGLFENPYTDPDYAKQVVGSTEMMAAGYEGHQQSVIMLKNADDIAPSFDVSSGKAVAYVPFTTTMVGDFGGRAESTGPVVDYDAVKKFFDVPQAHQDIEITSRTVTGAFGSYTVYDCELPSEEEDEQALQEADFILLKIDGPPEQTNSGQTPDNLTYSPYTAEWQREQSIGYDWYYDEACTELVQHADYPSSLAEGYAKGYYRSNRTNQGKTNPGDPDTLEFINKYIAKAQEYNKPIVFIVNYGRPMVMSDVEPYADVLLVGDNVADIAYMEALSNNRAPTGLLPVDMPMNMETVELSYEDSAHDMVPYKDSEGNRYTFGFGLTYGENGTEQIRDARTAKYADAYLDKEYPNAEKRALETYIELVEAFDESYYTGDIVTALAQAKTVYDDADADQETVNEAARALRDASKVLPSTDDLALHTNAHNVVSGSSFEVSAAFNTVQSSNTVVLNYSFDSEKFEYTGYKVPEGGNVGLVDEQHGEGWAKITLMIQDYSAKSLGDIQLKAKDDAILSKERQSVSAVAEYVIKNEQGEKGIYLSLAKTSFVTLGNGVDPEPGLPGDTNDDGVVDLIDLSNMVDWFGTTKAHADWESKYIFFDFNNNGSIDIYDISYVARLIQ